MSIPKKKANYKDDNDDDDDDWKLYWGNENIFLVIKNILFAMKTGDFEYPKKQNYLQNNLFVNKKMFHMAVKYFVFKLKLGVLRKFLYGKLSSSVSIITLEPFLIAWRYPKFFLA